MDICGLEATSRRNAGTGRLKMEKMPSSQNKIRILKFVFNVNFWCLIIEYNLEI